MRALHLFAGAGGSVLAGRLLGWESVGCVELDPYCCEVLEHRGERVLARDIRTFDATPLLGQVDVVVGGWPCQDLSLAGKRAGLAGTRSGLFWELLRVVDECKATYVFGENVPGLLSSNRGQDFGFILGALAARGYDARWAVLGARAVGAPHRRDRVWLVAHARGARLEERYGGGPRGSLSAPVLRGAGVLEPPLGGEPHGLANGLDWPASRGAWPAGRGAPQHAWEAPRTVTEKVPYRVARLRALGNGWVPQVAVKAWTLLTQEKE